MEIKLDARLSLIFHMTPPCRRVADVGTDHGLLVCALVKAGRAQWGVATDINAMPLEKARKEAARQGLLPRMTFHCTDGLTGVSPQELDAVVVAGMGGETIAHIMESWPHSRTPAITWLLQPMTKPERLRAWLYQEGYGILEENCCTVSGKTYSVMRVCFTGASVQAAPVALLLGAIDPALSTENYHYVENCIRQTRAAAAGLEASAQQKPQALALHRLAAALEALLEAR